MGVAVTIILFWRYRHEHVKYRKRRWNIRELLL